VQDEDSVETQAQFAEAMREGGVMDWLLDSAPGEDATGPAPDQQPVDTGSAVEQPRDDQGRFASTKMEDEPTDSAEEPISADAETEPEVESAVEEAEDEDIVIEVDDDLAAILDRYDGDVSKALLSLRDKESFTGRQANEIGELRQQLAEMQQLMAQGFQQVQQAPQQHWGPYQNDIEENPKGVVAEALERGDEQTLMAAIQAWGEEEPFQASAFLFSLSQQAQQTQVSQPEPPAPPVPQGSASLEDAMAAVVERHPDVEKHLPGLGETAKEFPTLRNFMESGTPAQQAQAFEELLVITKSRSSVADTSKAMKRVVLKTQEEVRADKAEAAVVSAKNQTAATASKGLDAFYERFAEMTGQGQEGDWIDRSNR
jgi:hypothetical protein